METRLRMELVRARLPRPSVQAELHDPAGNFIGRVDLYYPDRRLAMEYDGENHKERLVSDLPDRMLSSTPDTTFFALHSPTFVHPDQWLPRSATLGLPWRNIRLVRTKRLDERSNPRDSPDYPGVSPTDSASAHTPRRSCAAPGCDVRTTDTRGGAADRPATSARSRAGTRCRPPVRASIAGLRCRAPPGRARRRDTTAAGDFRCAAPRPGTGIGSLLPRMDRPPRWRVCGPRKRRIHSAQGPAACVAPPPEAQLELAPVALPPPVPNGASAPRGRA